MPPQNQPQSLYPTQPNVPPFDVLNAVAQKEARKREGRAATVVVAAAATTRG